MVLLLGDLGHESSGDCSRSAQLTSRWDVFLAPHHCSKGAIIDDDGDEDTVVTDRLGETAAPGAWIVAKRSALPHHRGQQGDKPATSRCLSYLQRLVGADHFRCTGENGDEDNPVPLVFEPTQPDAQVIPLQRRLLRDCSSARPRFRAAALISRAIRPGDRPFPGVTVASHELGSRRHRDMGFCSSPSYAPRGSMSTATTWCTARSGTATQPVPRAARRVEVHLSIGFPFRPPRVKPFDGSGTRSWHQEPDGTLVSLRRRGNAGWPWLNASQLIERISEWYSRDSAGWPGEAPDLDLGATSRRQPSRRSCFTGIA